MERLQRISWALLLVTAACGDDVSGTGDGSTGGETSTGDDTVDPTNVTTGVTMTSSSTGDTDATDGTTGDTDSTTGDTDSTTGDTDPTEGDSSSSTGDPTEGESSSSTGDPLDCGNGMVEDPEDCDGVQLDGATCESLGFASGDLSCADDCSFDTTMCEACGNDVIDDGEDCDGAELGDATCVSIGMGFTGGTLACGAECGFDTTGCTNFAQPAMGEVLFTEIMPNPTVVADADGEWFELHNPSADTSYQLGGCVISGADDEDDIDIVGDLIIPPGGYLTFAPSSMEDIGFTPDFEWEVNHFIGNGGDILVLTCDGTMVDTVDYDMFPPSAGASLNLDPDNYDATANNNGESWCDGTSLYNDPDTGTPGALNDECIAPAVYDIDFCRLQFPTTINEDVTTEVTVYGRLYIAGLTDLTTGNDIVPEVSGQVGYGPDGSDPAVDAGWIWIDATGNPGWDDAAEVNNDEYQGVLSVPAPGEYDFAYRFSGDSGATYTYCDGEAEGSTDGYQAANAGQMTSNAIAGDFDLYFSEYLEEGNNKALEIFNAGAEAVDLSACEVRQYFNGNDTSTSSVALTGTLEAGAAAVVCRSSAVQGILDECDIESGDLSFNGDDAVELQCAATTLDVFGQIGNDPGVEWVGSMGAVTRDVTLRRNCDASADPDGSDAFDPDAQWTAFPENTFDDLGQYICD